MALNYPYTQGTMNTFPNQQFFPQSQGNVYLINNPNEVASIPVGAGVSVALCAKEGLMYIKTMQNGNPMMISYKLNSLDSPTTSNENSQSSTQNNTNEVLKNYEDRLRKIESIIFKEKTKEKSGGKLEWEL